MFSKIVALLIFGLCINLGNTIDSDGTDFVFSYSAYTATSFSSAATASVVVIPLRKTQITCTFSYIKNTTGKPITRFVDPVYGQTNEFSFEFADVVLNPIYDAYNIYVRTSVDFRIFAKCTDRVKLIGRISDPINSFGDLFLIPSINFAATKYVLAMPTADTEVSGSLSFLPISKTGNITLTVLAYEDDIAYGRDQIFTYDTSLGNPQYYLTSMFNRFTNTSFSITSSAPIMITLSSPFVTASDLPSDYCGASCKQDYVIFMPIGSELKKCGTTTSLPEERMTTDDFATRFYTSPPNVVDSCKDISRITIYDDITDLAGRAIKVSPFGSTAISLINKHQSGFLTYEGQMSTYRQGSIVQADGITAFGHFIHYLPATNEWISGSTQFFTLAKNCYLEFYIKADKIDLNYVKIDQTPLTNLTYTTKDIVLFANNIKQFTTPITGYGVHTFANDAGISVSYVVCKSVNGPYNAAGYLTGFNKVQN